MTIPSPAANAILLVGHPNVGKSVLFHRLTGAYVNVSNYPGTTVEVTRASARFDREAMLLDTQWQSAANCLLEWMEKLEINSSCSV